MIENINKLRNQTDAPILECKKALEESNNNIDQAVILLRKRGQAISDKIAERESANGIIFSYIHSNKSLVFY